MRNAFNMYVWILHVQLLTQRCRDIVPLPCDLLWVGTCRIGEDSPQWSCCKLLRDLPNSPFRMVREKHQILLIIHIEWGKQAECVVGIFLLDKNSAQVFDLFWHGVIMINGVVNFVFCAWALLYGRVVLFVALELYWSIIFPHTATPWRGFAGVNVEWSSIFPSMSLRALFVFVLENLDPWKQWTLNRVLLSWSRA